MTHTRTVLPIRYDVHYQFGPYPTTALVANLRGMADHDDDATATSAILERARQNLIVAREVVAPSAAEVARRLGLTHANQWTRYETGKRKPSLAVLVRFCDEFDITLDFLLRNRTDGLSRTRMLALVARQAQKGLPEAWEPAGEPADTASATPGQPGPEGKSRGARTAGRAPAKAV